MRLRTLSLLFLTLIVLASIPAVSVLARTASTQHNYAMQETAAATTEPTCADSKLVDEISTDAKDLGDKLGTVASTGAGGVYSMMIDIANTRLKYEDMDTPSDLGCSYLVTETIILFANVADLGMVEMGSKLGLDQDMIAKNRQVVSDRLDKQVEKVNNLIKSDSAK